MCQPWLVIFTLFVSANWQGVFILAFDGSRETETCSAPNQPCNAPYPKLRRLNGVQVGHLQNVTFTDGRIRQLITKSLRPLLFEIPNFLSAEECEHIINLAGKMGLYESTTLPEIEDQKASTEVELKEDCEELLAADENNDGKISSSEVRKYLNETDGILVTVQEIDLMLREINFDKDGDGEISLTECMEGDHVVLDRYMKKLENNHPRYRTRLSQQTWLTMTGSKDVVLRDIQERVIQLTKLPRIFVERSEELQVVQYGIHGHYHAHYDSSRDNNASIRICCRNAGGGNDTNCSLCRFLTILYYLNDVPRGGETAFPVADEEIFNQTEFHEKDLSNLSTHCYDANIVVRPTRGTAIMWYNHVVDNVTGLLGTQDERSLHGGCDVLEGHKWIANNWINAPFKWTD